MKKCYWCEKIRKSNVNKIKITLRTFKDKHPYTFDIEQLCKECFKNFYKRIPKQFLPIIKKHKNKLDIYKNSNNTINFLSEENFDENFKMIQRIAVNTSTRKYKPSMKSIYMWDVEDLKQEIISELLEQYLKTRNNILRIENEEERRTKIDNIEKDYHKFFSFKACFFVYNLIKNMFSIKKTGKQSKEELSYQTRKRIEIEIALDKQKQFEEAECLKQNILSMN